MAKLSSITRNTKRKNLVDRFKKKRQEIKSKLYDKSLDIQERFQLQVKLDSLPKNSSKIRVRNLCAITGRSRGYYRKFDMSRCILRDLAGAGQVPGLRKSSW